GPRSAGAVPGPACYGRGGSEPTVTDAHVVLGHLDPERPLAGAVSLDAGAARAAVGRLAGALGLGIEACARGILRVADAEMLRALRVVTVERGVDPRRFALLAFGGAGPLHAVAIAEELGISRILVPRASGVLSALGLAAADRRAHRQRSVLLRGAALTGAALAAEAAALGDAARAALRDPGAGVDVAWDVRYRGQSHELTLRGVGADVGAVRDAFAAAHAERYGYADDEAGVEVVTVRATATTPGPDVTLAGDGAVPEAVRGPAVVALPEATLLVPPGWAGRPDTTGTLVLERAA
ncbi:MAG TPA: hydantoinase/oxoprolinase family protein, partial [Solirubrobacteraceae bacterium]|nr:hydantoinase/oxoprolinase family protein [Solirubrobacteraceae bacterium]